MSFSFDWYNNVVLAWYMNIISFCLDIDGRKSAFKGISLILVMYDLYQAPLLINIFKPYPNKSESLNSVHKFHNLHWFEARPMLHTFECIYRKLYIGWIYAGFPDVQNNQFFPNRMLKKKGKKLNMKFYGNLFVRFCKEP